MITILGLEELKNNIISGFSSQRKAFESSFGGGGQGVTEVSGSNNTLITENLDTSQTNRRPVIKENDFTERKVQDNKTEDFMEPNIMEQVNLLEKTPIYLSLSQFLDGQMALQFMISTRKLQNLSIHQKNYREQLRNLG